MANGPHTCIVHPESSNARTVRVASARDYAYATHALYRVPLLLREMVRARERAVRTRYTIARGNARVMRASTCAWDARTCTSTRARLSAIVLPVVYHTCMCE